MSIKIMKNTWEYSQQQGTCLNILLSLSDHANDRGISWPSLSRLAHLSRSSKRNVRRHLRTLEDTGEIFTIPRQSSTSFYLVTIGFSKDELVQILQDVLHSPTPKIKNYVTDIITKRGYATSIPPSYLSQGKNEQPVETIPKPQEGGTPTSGVGEDASVRGGGTPTSGGEDAHVREGGTPVSGGGGTPTSGGEDASVREGGTPTSPKPSVNHQLTPKKEPSSSSSSSEKAALAGIKTSDDDDADEEEHPLENSQGSLLALAKAAGVSAKNRRAILATPDIRLPDVLSELARCHDPKSNVKKPHVITPMNLLKGDFPDATCYTASYWERHIPEAILERSGLAKQVQEKFEEECGRRDAWDASLDEYPLSNGNGEKPSALPEIPEEHRKWWDVARGQLQLEMPSAAFNTWVRDTQLVSTEEDTFTIATKNKYACDWLENRLKSTLERLLTGGMMQKVQVNFVIK